MVVRNSLYLQRIVGNNDFLWRTKKDDREAILFCVYDAWICLPNGNIDNSAILKCWMPKGIPTIVMQQIIPKVRCVIAISHHPSANQSTFIKMLRHPESLGPLTTCLPKGNSENTPNFHNCTPKGMPIMVIIKSRPTMK